MAAQPAVAPPASSYIFRANFNADTVGMPPANNPAGPPIGDMIILNTPAGYVRVQTAVGDLNNQPAEVVMTGGYGGVDIWGRVAGTPPTSGVWYASWDSLCQYDTTYLFATINVRDSSGLVIAAVAYRPGGVLDFNDLYATSGIGVSWTPMKKQHFEFEIDLDAKTVNLKIDGTPVAVATGAPYYQSTAANINSLNFEVGYTTDQAYAVDNMVIYCAKKKANGPGPNDNANPNAFEGSDNKWDGQGNANPDNNGADNSNPNAGNGGGNGNGNGPKK